MKALLTTIAPLILLVFASTSFAATMAVCRDITHGTSVNTLYCCHITKLDKLQWVNSKDDCQSLGGQSADNCNTFTEIEGAHYFVQEFCKKGTVPKFLMSNTNN